LFDFFIARLSRRKHDEGTGEWSFDRHKLTRRLSRHPLVPSLFSMTWKYWKSTGITVYNCKYVLIA